MVTMMMGLKIGLISQINKVKDILFGNIHTEDAKNLVAEDGGYLIV